MGTPLHNSNTVLVEDLTSDDSPTLEKIEFLAGLLQQYREAKSARSADVMVVLPGDVDSIEDELNKLRIGSADPGWDERVKQAWATIEGRCASRATLEIFEASLAPLLDPLRRDSSAVETLEAELRLQQARLQTLLVLADLLDELVWTQPDPIAPGDTESV
jgi:hypothetical protein